MRVLGLETATWTASVAAIAEGRVLAERSLRVSRSHAPTLLGLIDEVLGEAALDVGDLDLLAVSIGPGSFTGLRVGLSIAKGLALATGVPVTGVPTLEALACAAGPRPGLIAPVLDARKGEVYGATFRWHGEALREVSPATVLAPGRFADRLQTPCLLLGDGVDAHREVWSARFGGAAELVSIDEIAPRGAVVAALGAERFLLDGAMPVGDLEPKYVRRAEAEMNHARQGGGTPVERGKIDRDGVVG